MAIPAKLTIPAHVVFQEIDNELVLLDLNQGVYFGLKDVAKRCWELIAAQQDLPSIVATLLEEFDVAEATLKADVETLMADFTAHGLVITGE